MTKGGVVQLGPDGKPLMRSREAAAAGVATFDKGRLKKISNESGHYKPQVDYLLQAVEQLAKDGALFKNEITDAAGKAVVPGSKEYKLYQAVRDKQKKAPDLKKRVAEIARAIVRAGPDDAAALEQEMQTIKAELDSYGKALDVLRKLGIGPSNRIDETIEVAVVQGDKAADGKAFREAPQTKSSAEAFMNSGGGNLEQATAKQAMLAELGGRKLADKASNKPIVSDDRDRAKPSAADVAGALAGVEEEVALSFDDDDQEAAPAAAGPANPGASAATPPAENAGAPEAPAPEAPLYSVKAAPAAARPTPPAASAAAPAADGGEDALALPPDDQEAAPAGAAEAGNYGGAYKVIPLEK